MKTGIRWGGSTIWDVIRTDGSKVSREDLHLPGRKCLLCGEPGPRLRQKPPPLRGGADRGNSADSGGEVRKMKPSDGFPAFLTAAVRTALTAEVETTPKPGLVDLHDNGFPPGHGLRYLSEKRRCHLPLSRGDGGNRPGSGAALSRNSSGASARWGVRAEDAHVRGHRRGEHPQGGHLFPGNSLRCRRLLFPEAGDDFCRRRSSPPPGRW